MKKALIYTIVFVGIQFLVGGLVTLIFRLLKGESAAPGAMELIITTAATSVVTVIVFLTTKWTVVSRHWVRTRPWFVLFWCVLAALGLLVPSEWLQELMPALPNLAEETFDLIMKDRWGYVVVGLLAPLTEEMVQSVLAFWMRIEK